MYIYIYTSLAHTTQFTQPGDNYLPVDNGSGHLDKGGSYVSFVDSKTHDLTIVIETMVILGGREGGPVRLCVPFYTRVMIIQSVSGQVYLNIASVSKLLHSNYKDRW